MGKGLSYLTGWGASPSKDKKEEKIEAQRGDNFAVTIKKTDGDAELAKGQGSWLSYLEIDGSVIWRIDQDLPLWEPMKPKMSDGSIVLKSDSYARIDVAPMHAKTWEKAEANKLELETLQRHDRKLREEAEKRRAAAKK